jgi:hypothetical protein
VSLFKFKLGLNISYAKPIRITRKPIHGGPKPIDEESPTFIFVHVGIQSSNNKTITKKIAAKMRFEALLIPLETGPAGGAVN